MNMGVLSVRVGCRMFPSEGGGAYASRHEVGDSVCAVWVCARGDDAHSVLPDRV